MNRENTVRQAGGFILQLMPFAEASLIDRLEQKVKEINSITSMLDQDMTPEIILENILGEFGLELLEKQPAVFHCNCTRERVEKAIISIGQREINENASGK